MADCICGGNGDPKAGRLLLGCPACDKPPKLLMDQWGALKVKYTVDLSPSTQRVLDEISLKMIRQEFECLHGLVPGPHPFPTLRQQDTVAEPAVRRIDDCGFGHNRWSKECPCTCGATWDDTCPEHGVPGGATFDW